MADRRTDDAPLAPRRSLGGRAQSQEESAPSQPSGRPANRTSAAVAAGQGRDGASTDEDERTQGGPQPPAPPREGGDTSTRSGSTGRGTASGATSGGRPARPRGTRKARLRLTHVDPWSVMKIAFLLSIALGIVTVVAVALVWSVLDAAGVWTSINDTVQDVLGSQSGSTFDIEAYLGTSRVLGFTMIVAVVDVVLITALATLGAFLYNLSAALLGGLEVTLAEDER